MGKGMTHARFLVFGATGYTGRHVVASARAAGAEVVAHLRPGSARAATVGAQLAASGARLAEVPWEPGAIGALVAEVAPTHVFALLGITKAGARREAARTGELATYSQVDTGYTRWILDACAGLEAPPRVVYLSSLGAGRPGGNAYLQARHEVEQALEASSLDFTTVRPSFISGADRDESRPGERVGSVLSDVGLGLLAMLGARSLRDRYGTVSGAELGQLLVQAASHPGFSRRTVDMLDLRQLVRSSA